MRTSRSAPVPSALQADEPRPPCRQGTELLHRLLQYVVLILGARLKWWQGAGLVGGSLALRKAMPFNFRLLLSWLLLGTVHSVLPARNHMQHA